MKKIKNRIWVSIIFVLFLFTSTQALSDGLLTYPKSRTIDDIQGVDQAAMNFYYPDSSLPNQGVTDAGSTIKAIVDSIGTTKKATIYLRNNSHNINTDYTYLTSDDYSIYDNITFVFENGARLATTSGVTITMASPLSISAQSKQQIFTGSGAISFLNNGNRPATWWGFSPSATASINTVALQSAINSVIGVKYGSGEIETGSFTTGVGSYVEISSGKYDINDQIKYQYYTRIKSDRAIIYQTDPTKDIFHSDAVYQNEFSGLILVGGKTQIFAQNGATGVSGREAAIIQINDCEFNKSADYALQISHSGASGGCQAMIKNSRFVRCAKSAKTEIDWVTFEDVWVEPRVAYWAANTAQFYSAIGVTAFSRVLFIVDKTGGDLTGSTYRWVDNYKTVNFKDCRFGAEGGGIPAVYNYTDMLNASLTSPYSASAPTITIRDSWVYNRKGVGGTIVLKTGLPSCIIIEGNRGGENASDGMWINTEEMEDGKTLTAYLAAADIHEPLCSIRIKNNIGWEQPVTGNATDTELLSPFTEFEFPNVNGNIHKLTERLYTDNTVQVWGKKYNQTGVSPATPNDTQSIVTTTIPVSAIAAAKAYLVTVKGNPSGIDANNMDVVVALVTIKTAADTTKTVTSTTLVAGVTLGLVASISSNYLRITVTGYTAGHAGTSQEVRIIDIL